MVHRITLRSNPRLLFLWLIIVGLPVIGILMLIKLGRLGGIIAIIGAGIVSYHFLQFTISQMKHTIETSEEGITCHLSASKEAHLSWNNISCAGFCRQKGVKPFIFLYSEQDDQLVIIPREFSDFNTLIEEIKDKTNFQEIQLSKDEMIEDWLRDQLEEDC